MSINTEHLKRCIQTLEIALSMLRQNDPESLEYEVFRNSAVKGFELTLEICGKLLRKDLKPFFASPKAVDSLIFKDLFRHAAKHGILSVEEVERWLNYRDNRDNTAHDYGEGFAEETLTLLPDFIEDAKRLEKRLSHADS